MLDDRGLEDYFARLALPSAAQSLVRRVRSSPPLAGTTGGRGSMSGRFASRKMGLTLGSDARTTEFLGFLLYETSATVLEFWEQPLELRLSFPGTGGRTVTTRTRVDVLVLEDAGVFVDEWKTDEQMIELASESPGRYQRGEGGWRSEAAETAAATLGIGFRLRTPAGVPPAVVQNARFLLDYWRSNELLPAESLEMVRAAATDAPGLSVAEILRRCPAVAPDQLYLAIARGELYADLSCQRLSDAAWTAVWPDETMAFAFSAEAPGAAGPTAPPPLSLEPGTEVAMGGRALTVVATNETSVTFRADGGALLPLSRGEVAERHRRGELVLAGEPHDPTLEVLRTASPRALRVAHRRLETLRESWAGRTAAIPGRTRRRWEAAYRKDVATGGRGFGGLLPGKVGRPAGPRLEPGLEALISAELERSHEAADPPSQVVVHARIVRAANEAGYAPPCLATVTARMRAWATDKVVEAQRGRKAAYQVKAFNSYLAYDTPRHGERPWERAHVDHTQIDLVCVDSANRAPLGRPWLSLMLDAYSRRVLAYWLTFDEPSYRSTMMLFRRCVERWGRLPDEVVVDDGAEFNSTYFEQLLARYEVHKLTRRGDPRAGSVLERLFGSTNTRLWWALRGQTRPTKDVRSMSPEVDPERRAVWTLAALAPVLDGFFFELYDTLVHTTLGATPRAAYESRIAVTGERPIRLIANDEAFRFATLPTTRKGRATVSYVRGVTINGRRYQGPEFRIPGVAGAAVPVRYDPMDVRHAFAYLKGAWVEIWCDGLRQFPPVSEKLAAFISAELAAQARLVGRARPVNAARIGAFLDDAKASERVLVQLRRDAELALSTPASPPQATAGPVAGLGLSVTDGDPAPVADLDLEIFGNY
ncbi:MAG TPA: DDE-type integrase/transposase/recombinase [Candidatus Limnocylindrales bacterium]|nr:DDE-type integrase/transposase/recombinase [Candidatus Limnocylindrales bacterium]